MYSSLKNFSNCQNLDHLAYICLNSEPIYYTNSRPICEIDLLKSTIIPKNCQVSIINSPFKIWHKLSKPNTWIYVFPKKTDVTLYCFDIHKTLFLENTGIIQINPECKLFTSSLILLTDKIVINTTYHSPIPKLKLVNICCINSTKNNMNLNLKPVNPTNFHFETLKKSVIN